MTGQLNLFDDSEFYSKEIGVALDNIDDFHKKLNEINNHYCNLAWECEWAGKRRSLMGDLGEVITTEIINYCVEKLGISDYKVYRGGEKKIKCVKSANSYFMAQVDRHLEIRQILALILESKTYLDKTFIERANYDFYLIKKHKENKNDIFAFIISLQNCIKKETFNFFMEEGNIDECFFLMEGKRNGNRPIWDPKHRKEIKKDLLVNCINKIISKLKPFTDYE